jgi:hypothetical protein
MRLKRGTRITIETERTLIVRQTRSARAWCEDCQREVDFVQLQQRQQLLRNTAREISTDSSMSKLHLAEQSDGSVLICLESLMKCG